MDEKQEEFRPVNRVLGTQASLGPIPAELIFPFAIIVLTSYFVVRGVFGGSWLLTALCAGWLGSTWWILTSSRNWRYLSKFVGVPRWTRGVARYKSILELKSYECQSKNSKSKKTRKSIRKL